MNEDSNEKSIYSVASKTVGVRIQKAVDPEVVALLDDSDLSRFGSDDEDFEEDFVVKANLPDEVEDVEFDEKLCLAEKSGGSRREIAESSGSHSQGNIFNFVGAGEVSNHQAVAGAYCTGEKLRSRRLIDDQFEMVRTSLVVFHQDSIGIRLCISTFVPSASNVYYNETSTLQNPIYFIEYKEGSS